MATETSGGSVISRCGSKTIPALSGVCRVPLVTKWRKGVW